MGEQDAGEEIEMGKEIFCRVKPGAGVAARGVVEDVHEDLLLRLAGQSGVGDGIVLPEGSEVAGLPAAHGFPRLLEANVRGEMVGESAAADAGAVGLEMEAAQEFAGDGAVGGEGRVASATTSAGQSR